MVLVVTQRDLQSVAAWVPLFNLPYEKPLVQALQATQFEKKGVRLDKRFGPLGATILLELRPKNGGIILDIAEAKVSGLSLFGTVRKVAMDTLFKQLSGLQSYLTVTRDAGDLLVKIKSVEISEITMADGSLSLKVQL